VLQCVAVCCSVNVRVLQCVAMCCSVLQCFAVCCSVNVHEQASEAGCNGCVFQLSLESESCSEERRFVGVAM